MGGVPQSLGISLMQGNPLFLQNLLSTSGVVFSLSYLIDGFYYPVIQSKAQTQETGYDPFLTYTLDLTKKPLLFRLKKSDINSAFSQFYLYDDPTKFMYAENDVIYIGNYELNSNKIYDFDLNFYGVNRSWNISYSPKGDNFVLTTSDSNGFSQSASLVSETNFVGVTSDFIDVSSSTFTLNYNTNYNPDVSDETYKNIICYMKRT